MKVDEKYERGKFIVSKLKNISTISNRELAKKTGIVEQTISSYLNIRKIPTDSVYENIAKEIGISSKDFEQLIFEADKLVMEKKYPERFEKDLETTSSNIDNLTDKEILEQVVFKRSGHNVSETDLDVIMGVINSFKK